MKKHINYEKWFLNFTLRNCRTKLVHHNTIITSLAMICSMQKENRKCKPILKRAYS